MAAPTIKHAAIEITLITASKPAPVDNKYRAVINAKAPITRFIRNFIESTLALHWSGTYCDNTASVIGICPNTKPMANRETANRA